MENKHFLVGQTLHFLPVVNQQEKLFMSVDHIFLSTLENKDRILNMMARHSLHNS
jgi:hypothetical protein